MLILESSFHPLYERQVFPPSATQADVYAAAVRPIVEDVLAGYNGTVMAYGQTGAGKTHTLSCVQPEAIGAVPRAIAEVFRGTSRAGSRVTHTVLLSYVQIYMELIQVGEKGGEGEGETAWLFS